MTWASIAFKSVLCCDTVEVIEEGHVYGRRADDEEFHFWCISPRTMRTCDTYVIEKNPRAILLVDEINAFADAELNYMRLHFPFFIAVGSHDIENALVGKLIGLNYGLELNTLHF